MPGGGRITIRTGSMAFAEGQARPAPDLAPGAYVFLEVADTGVGMGPDVLAHVFEPFFTTKATGRGRGLGLSIAYGIVRDYGGRISIRSKEGEGATVRVVLPGAPF